MRRATTYLSLLAAVAAIVLCSTASASTSHTYAFGQNVDPTLASAINNGQGSSSSVYHLLVFGGKPDLTHADSASGISQRDDLSVVGGQSVTVTAAQAAQLSSQPGVQFVTVDTPMAPTALPTPPGPAGPPAPPGPGGPGAQGAASTPVSSSALSTYYPQIDGATSLWSKGYTGAGVGIAIIDSGVTPRADFGSRLVQVQLPTQDGTALNDTVGHGSAVAGVAAGQSSDGSYIGVAPASTVYAINVARADGVYTSDVIAGLNWVLQNAAQDHIQVVNLSLSQTTPSSYYANTLDAAVDLLWKQGIVVVVSSGNLGPGSEDFAPANDPWAIAVGASDSNDTAKTSDDTLASFSSYGVTPDGFSKPDIVAPGRHIVTTIPASSTIAQSAPAGYLVGSGEDNYVKISGTSFSAPQVTGAVALLLQQHPNLNPDQVKAVLTENERPLAGSNAGALDLGDVTAALARPADAANRGYRWSNWAHPGEHTNDFLTSLATAMQALKADLQATTQGVQAQVACLQAKLAPAPKAPKPPKGAPTPPPPPNPAYTNCAQQLDNTAALWDAAAQTWSQANQADNAANDEQKAADEYQAASADWTKAGNTQNSATDTDNETLATEKAAMWDHAALWDGASFTGALWDGAVWDSSASWNGAVWDGAVWDGAVWDGAVWDAAVWDGAVWDAAVWDAATWD